MFKKILVPVDGSKSSKKALAFAVSLARRFSGGLVLFHAEELVYYGAPVPDYMGWSSGLTGETMKALHEQGNKVLEEAKAVAEKEISQVDTRLVIGSPAAAICDAAEKESCDLIVMGSRGLSDVKGMFLGSVSHAVLQRSKCPVLLVKESSSVEGAQEKPASASAKK